MPSFKAPQLSKMVNPKTGLHDSCFTFDVEDCDSLSFMADNTSDISVESVQKSLHNPWWNSFINAFLESSSKFFSKTYTVETINKITKHTLTGSKTDVFPVNVILIPKSIQIFAGVFTINWRYTIEPMIIPDFDDLPDSKIQGMEELNIDELPIGNSTEVLEIDNPSKFYDKQRVKEARLKAKLAHYKAERQLVEYNDKYGDDISDSDYVSDETSD